MNKKKKFVPPKVDVTTKPRKRKSLKSKIAVPLTLSHLSHYFDWRHSSYSFNHSPILYRIATTIWLYLPQIPPEQYSVDFSEADDVSLVVSHSLQSRPPAMVTTSPKGDLLVLLEVQRDLDDYAEKQFLIVLYPYISSCKMMDDSTLQLLDGTYTTMWEIDGVDHVTHLAMDKLGIIYFTTGESVYRISKAEGDMYLDTFEDIFTPSNDTSHITCLWRQHNDVYLTIQDWDSEENLDLYKVVVPKDKGVSSVDTPGTPGDRGQSPSFGSRGHSPRNAKKRRSRSRSGSTGYGSDYGGSSPRGRGTANDSNEFVTKVRTFSLRYNSRIWQLGTMRFEKKLLLAVGAAQLGSAPQILQIGFKKEIKAMPIMGSGKTFKSVMWPRSVPDQVPHSIEFHKATKTWFCILPVAKGKDGALYWMQFRMDKLKKKVVWQRLVPVPEAARSGDWLYYDELRDVLVGFARGDEETKQYVFKFLPDFTKHLWVEFDDEDDEKADAAESALSKGPQLQRAMPLNVVKSKRSKTAKDGAAKSSKNVGTPSAESLIKPSSARRKKAQSTADVAKIKRKGKKAAKSGKMMKAPKVRTWKSTESGHARGSGSRGSMALDSVNDGGGGGPEKEKKKRKRKRAQTTKPDAGKGGGKKKEKKASSSKADESQSAAAPQVEEAEDVMD